ncbi:hypothetical protein GQR58_000304 [Nymphon striatum]|nr:hypothetical protein GQR58_000304 [Nymphon striatum]
MNIRYTVISAQTSPAPLMCLWCWMWGQLWPGVFAGEPEAPSGGWTVSLRPVGPDAVTACLQIQRDDSAMGYRARGRQSYFDSPHGYGWDMDDQDNSGLEAVCAISRQGTHSALVSAPDPGGDAGSARQIVSVGAAEWKPEAQEARPSRYSAQGSPDQVARPSVSAIADEGRVAAGLVATGTLTGSSATLGGTSAAAANVSRALAMSAPRILGNVGDSTTTVLSDFDPMLGPVLAIDPSDEDRLGQLCIGVLGARRGRRGMVRETEHEIS